MTLAYHKKSCSICSYLELSAVSLLGSGLAGAGAGPPFPAGDCCSKVSVSQLYFDKLAFFDCLREKVEIYKQILRGRS